MMGLSFLVGALYICASASAEKIGVRRRTTEMTEQFYLLFAQGHSMPTAAPVNPPTPSPIPAPTPSPVSAPTESPVSTPTSAPVTAPTKSPVESTDAPATPPPSVTPTMAPVSTSSPTEAPVTVAPTSVPTTGPTKAPVTAAPTGSPTTAPTEQCNSDGETRALLIRITLNSVSDPTALLTPGTSQNRALMWITDDDPLTLCPNDPGLKQRYTMALFYYSTNGNRWDDCSAPANLTDPVLVEEASRNCGLADENAWLIGESECTWGGVRCEVEEKVTRIDVEENGLSGVLPFELQELGELTHLLLEEGIIGGSIPSELGNIATLRVIDLNVNNITGSIPDEIYKLTNLAQIDLNDNALSGSISSLIGSLLNLEFLQLHGNRLTGTIPTTIGLLQSLATATFESNSFMGSMPAEVCMLRQTNPAEFTTLTADCFAVSGRDSPPFLQCDSPVCCTRCF